MHELSLVEDMRELILDKARDDGFSRVETVWLEVGELSCVEAEAMVFCFEAVMVDTPAAEAELKLVKVKGRAYCPDCGQTSAVTQLYDACPVCGNFAVRITEGRDVRLRSLEVC